MTFNSMPSDSEALPVAIASNPASSSDIEFFSQFSAQSSPRSSVQRRLRLWFGLGVCGLLVVGGATIARQRFVSPAEAGGVAAAQAEMLPVETIVVEPVSKYEVQRTYTGEIAAQRSSDLGFERSGQLVAVLVREGDRVSQGQPLARLDISNLQTQRRQLEAEKARAIAQLAELQAGPRAEDIAAAEAAVRDAEQQLRLQAAQYARRKMLYEEGAISAEELDEFGFGQNSLQARLDQAKSNLTELQNGTRQEQIAAQIALVQQLDAAVADVEVTIDKSTIRAPFDGIVATQAIDEGTVVGAGQSVIEVVEASNPEVRIGIPTDTVSTLAVGDSELVTVGQQTYPAQVAAILPEVDLETRTQTVVLQLAGISAVEAAPGQTARVEVVEAIPSEGFWLPTSALTQGIRGLWNCYVVTQPTGNETNSDTYSDTYIVEQQAVEILHETGDQVLVRGTLRPGDLVVASGTHRLVPGQLVEPL
ncbi:MAG: efflux RND transporter periplasmic adaptor subunit [Cyanobacteria bacterium P01_H01_bin.121]